ncbi:MAG: helix-turn-helix domain-containing protein [Acidimicrobiales bacterium]
MSPLFHDGESNDGDGDTDDHDDVDDHDQHDVPDDHDDEDDDTLFISPASYWLEHPRELTDALEQLAGIDTASTAGLERLGAVIANGVRAAINVAVDIVVSPFHTVTRPIPPTERLTLSVGEAAGLLGISRALAYEAVQSGEIPCVRIGRRILIPKVQLNRLLGDDPPSAPNESEVDQEKGA